MPVSTQLVRNGKPVQVGGWSWWHLIRLQDAMAEETGKSIDETPMFPRSGSYTFREDHVFEAPESDIWERGFTPGATFRFVIQAGDEYKAWR